LGENYTYRCPECLRKYGTSGPWEFYRDDKGRRMPYGHPGPYTQEAALRGIAGLFADMLCLDCGQEVNVVLEEFNKKPVKSILSWIGLKKENNDTEKCPACGSRKLLLSPPEKTLITCPSCGKGQLQLVDHWSS